MKRTTALILSAAMMVVGMVDTTCWIFWLGQGWMPNLGLFVFITGLIIFLVKVTE